MSNCPYCGAPGGGSGSCGSCQHHRSGSSVNSGMANRNSGGNGGSNGCFAKGTKILTPSGLQDIAALKEGDLVSAYCSKNSVLVSRRVLAVVRHSNQKLWHLAFEGDNSMRTTPIHSFRTPKGWRVASKLRTGDRVYCSGQNGQIRVKTVIKSASLGAAEDVYNLIVERDFTFIAGGAVAHSFTYFRGLRCVFWSLFKGKLTSGDIQVTAT